MISNESRRDCHPADVGLSGEFLLHDVRSFHEIVKQKTFLMFHTGMEVVFFLLFLCRFQDLSRHLAQEGSRI